MNVYAFYRFGKRLKDVTSFAMQPMFEKHEWDKNFPFELDFPVMPTMEAVYANCLYFLEKTEGFNLDKSRDKVSEIETLHLRYWKLIGAAYKTHDLSEVFTLFSRWLRQTNRLVDEFEETLKHEIDRINAFVTGDKGDKDIEILADRAHEGFSAEVRKHLPDTAIYDFKEAGKCYLFDCYTAMGYHILRGTEAVVLKYLETLTGSAWTGTPGWGQYVQKLEKKSLNVPKRIIQRLNEIREYERNPIAHPEFIVEPDEAMPLYNLAHGVIPMIVKEMQRLNPK